jgi:SlyX protein
VSADSKQSDLEQRVVELETRLAFQEQALAELSDALAASRLEVAQNAQLLRRALDEMKQSRADFFADPAEEPPPPHY